MKRSAVVGEEDRPGIAGRVVGAGVGGSAHHRPRARVRVVVVRPAMGARALVVLRRARREVVVAIGLPGSLVARPSVAQAAHGRRDQVDLLTLVPADVAERDPAPRSQREAKGVAKALRVELGADVGKRGVARGRRDARAGPSRCGRRASACRRDSARRRCGGRAGSTKLKLAASPFPTQSVPSGAERTVPIEWESPSDGMQSRVFAGAGQTPLV